jgi:hypothetical protein
MTFLILIAVLNMVLSSIIFPGTCRFSLSSYLKFLGLMAVVTAARFAIFKMASHVPADPDSVATMQSISPWQFMLVFWEDAFFTLPTIVLEKLGSSTFARNLMLGLSSVAFASGHIAYGLPWAFITLFYVPFISYRYGKKNGLGTVMACHITYDMVTWLTMMHILKG